MNELENDRAMQEPRKCPQCGTPLPAGVLDGLCPACLLQQGASADTATQPEQPPFEPPPLEQLANLFPQLEVLALIGKGGMGAVYKARQPALDRFVALKILPAQPASGPAFAERFNREARALARLSHPNIVGVHEFGAAGDLHYFLMEFVDGVNLRQLQKSGRLSPREALQIIPQICDALQYAHDEGVVHRDIKPENVLVDRKGRVKIADFGLAKILSREPDDLRLTGEGQVMGTPHYMAPEQVEHPLEVDHRADIYSLGVVFYEMLTGELPLGKFAPPSRKVQVDVRLDEVVLHALEKEPQHRYQHASQVKTDVVTIAASEGSSASAAGLGAPSAGQAASQSASPPAPPIRARKKWKGEFLGIGAAVQAIGLACFFIPHFGFVLGIVLLLIGGRMALKLICTHCGNRTTKDARICTVCGAHFEKPGPGHDHPSQGKTVTDEQRVREQVRGPAIGLLVTGIANWILIPLAVLLIWQYAAASKTSGTPQSVVMLVSLLPLVLCSFIIFAALRMRQLESWGMAVVASVLAAIVTPGNIIGLPLGIWSLAVLTRREVREAFRVARQGVTANGTRILASSGGAARPRLALWIWSVVLVCVLVGVAGMIVFENLMSRQAQSKPTSQLLHRLGLPGDLAVRETEPAVAIQGQVADIQPDGLIRFRSLVRQPNDVGKPLEDYRFVNSDFVNVERITDLQNRVIPFDTAHNQRRFQYLLRLSPPVPPGGVVSFIMEGTMTGLINPGAESGVFDYHMHHSPGSGRPTRRIEVHRLPAGAELVESSLDRLRQQTNEGRIELSIDEVIPPKGSLEVRYRYRLAAVSKPELNEAVNQAVQTISQCAESDPRVQTALESLRSHDAREVVVALVPHLDSTTDTVRRSAIYALWNGGFADIGPATRALQQLLTHSEEYTRGMAALALGQNRVGDSFDGLIKMTAEDTSGYARRCAAYALGLLGDARAEATLKEALNDPDPLVKGNAAKALEMLKQERRAPPEASNASGETPRLRYLAWQDDWRSQQAASAWHPDGSSVTNADEVRLLKSVEPSGCDVSATTAAARDPRFLHLWFSHPAFDQQSLIRVALLDAAGQPIKLGADGTMASGVHPAGAGRGRDAWLTHTLSPGEGEGIPNTVTVHLRYATGPLENEVEVPRDFSGGMSLTGGGRLNGLGQDARGKAFVAIAMDAQALQARQFGVIAVTKDGRRLAPAGTTRTGNSDGTGVHVEQFTFELPLAEVAHFRIGTRPVRTMDWNDVVLQRQGASASAERWAPELQPGEKPDPARILNEARDLTAKGQYEDALQRHIWYHNHALEYGVGQGGVRVSFALSYWVELGRKYPKARQALVEIRDLKTRELREGRGKSDLFQDVSGINAYLKEEAATFALFKTLLERQPDLAKQCYFFAEDLLVDRGEYSVCLSLFPEFRQRFILIRHGREMDLAFQESQTKANPPMGRTPDRQRADDQFVSQTRKLIEILVGTGRLADAEKIRDQAVAILDEDRLKSAVDDARKKTGK